MEKIEILFSKKEIEDRICEMANQINQEYNNDEVILIGVLKGSFIFIADLIRKLNVKNNVDFISVSSYGDKTETSGVVRLIKDLDHDISGKNIIVIEDIVDTGLTLKYLVDLLEQREPKSIKICTLLNKVCRRRVELNIDYIGFDIDDYFVVGYGIDYAQKYRSLEYIGNVIIQEDK